MATAARNPKLEKLLGRMTDMDHQTVEKDFIGMVYGPPGTGKTTLAMGLAQRLAEGRRIVYIDSSDGWVALEPFPSLMSNVAHVRYDEYADLPTIAAQLRLPDDKRVEALQDVAVVVIDEGSSIAADILDVVLRERLGTKPDDIPDVVPEWSDYFPQKELFRKAVLAFHDVEGVHVIIVSHAKEKADHRKVKVMHPDFPDKLLGELMKVMHIVGYVTAETGMKAGEVTYQRRIQIQPTALVSAKTRISGLPFKLELPAFVKGVAEWINNDEARTADLLSDEEVEGGEVDALPTDGIPISDEGDPDDEGIEVE